MSISSPAPQVSTPFHDPDLNAVRAAGGVLAVGQLRLRLPRVFGFCGGVRNALAQLQRAVAAKRGSNRIWLLGEIIHNETVNGYFRSQGVRVLPECDVPSILDQATPGDLLVLPAFGLPESLDRRIRERFRGQCRFLDTTCGYVRRVWGFVARAAAEGRTIAIHGKADHPETRATVSRALTEQNAVIIVPDIPRAKQLASSLAAPVPAAVYPPGLVRHPEQVDCRHLALASQTTMLCSETEIVARILDETVRDLQGDFLPANTVCRATEHRQQAARELCSAACDLCLVIGGFSRSNTNQLYRLAQDYCPAYFIQNADAIGVDRIRHYRPDLDREEVTTDWLPAPARDIALLAGASCPPVDVGGVIRKLRRLFGDPRV